nr:MATE family efflux transporter [Methanosarcina horonobensis]
MPWSTRKRKSREDSWERFFSLSLILSVLIAVPCLLYLDGILEVFGATPGILPYAMEYLGYIIAGGIFFVFGVAVQHIVRAEGNARLAMNAMLIGAGINIVLDPFFYLRLWNGRAGSCDCNRAIPGSKFGLASAVLP